MVRTVAAGPADTASAAAAAEAAERVLAREGGARTHGLDDLRTGENALRCALDTVGGTWSILVLYALRDGPVRYASIKRAVEAVRDVLKEPTKPAPPPPPKRYNPLESE